MIKHAWPLVVMWYGEMETSDTMIAIQMVEDLVTPSILENNIKRWISSFNFNPFNLQKKGNQEGVFLWNLFLNNEYTDDYSQEGRGTWLTDDRREKHLTFVAITNSLIGNFSIPIVPMLPNLSDGQTYFAFYKFALTMVDACCARVAQEGGV